MKQIMSEYKGDSASMYLVPIGDTHIGNICYNPEYLKKAFKFIDTNKGRCRIILMGDMLECATKVSVGKGVYDEKYNTQKQFDELVELFTPYKNIIDMVVIGNHELRVSQLTSFDVLKEFCYRLHIESKYVEYDGVLNIKVGDICYSSYVWHGASGGATDGGAVNNLVKMRDRVVAHCYFMGHTHKLISLTKEIAIPQSGSDVVSNMPQIFVNTGSALEAGGYGSQKGYSLIEKGFGVVELFSTTRKMVFHKIDDLI